MHQEEMTAVDIKNQMSEQDWNRIYNMTQDVNLYDNLIKSLFAFNLFSRFSNWLPNSAKTRHTKMPLENDESSFLLSTNLKRKKPRKTPLFKKQYLPLQRPPRHVNRNIFCHLSSRHILHFGVPSFEKCKDGSCS